MKIEPRMVAEIAGGFTVFALSAARHMPAPIPGSVFYRWAFDTVQDLAKNNDRIGEVRVPNQAALMGQKEVTK